MESDEQTEEEIKCKSERIQRHGVGSQNSWLLFWVSVSRESGLSIIVLKSSIPINMTASNGSLSDLSVPFVNYLVSDEPSYFICDIDPLS